MVMLSLELRKEPGSERAGKAACAWDLCLRRRRDLSLGRATEAVQELERSPVFARLYSRSSKFGLGMLQICDNPP